MMAQRKTEAWITCALDDSTVANAMVLAESIRKCRTTRTIGVITSKNVSREKLIDLRKTFDAVFSMDECYIPEGDFKGHEATQAKVFAFSLGFLEKCVFLSPNSLMLENVDNLFEDDSRFKFIRNDETGKIDFSFFVFEPSKNLWEHLSESINGQAPAISDSFLSDWLSNQESAMNMDWMAADIVAKFSLSSAALLSVPIRTPIVQFVEMKNAVDLCHQLSALNKVNLGLLEKLIVMTWEEIYRTNLVKNPIPVPLAGSNYSETFRNEPIAIIGMSCRYPGANSLEEFWNMLYKGEEGVREPPPFRWTKEHSIRVSPAERKTNAGFLAASVDEFDAKFFGMSPKEATYMDPQSRLLHEVLWESLEDSGIDPLSLYGTHTGIFTGSWMNDYKDIAQGSMERDFFRTYMGNSIGAAAARLSFLLGLTGPSIATESGCSSAIVAVDLAVKSLRSGETNLAMAGGVNLLLHAFTSNIMEFVIAPNGRCKTFDSKADGFGRAEGCGVMVLKRLSDALRDRDNIWAIIRGSAVSQEGLSRSLGTPTVHCEALAMQLALKDANVAPEQVTFVETHGTGTSVGDPMEIAAIAKAYYTPRRETPLVIGSVKTNVGHTESCSGITGIMKTVLAMQHQLIPKHRNLDTLNPEVFLDSIPAMIPIEPVSWLKVTGKPRIAGVSSFGITGTDGHVILQEAPDYKLPKISFHLERPKHLLKISGKSSEALDELLKKYENEFSMRAEKVDEKSDDGFGDAAFSANVGRATFNHRVFIIAQDYQEAAKSIAEKQYIQGEVKDNESRPLCFLFTGQGSQYQGMAKMMYDTSPVFRIHFDECDRILRTGYNLTIRQVLWESEPASKDISRTIYSQISIFCVEYCLLKMWQSWGIQPDYVLGHSLGEFAAAVAAGFLDFKDAIRLVAERSQLIDNLPRGSMLVIKASKPEVDTLLNTAQIDLDFAAVNSLEQTVVAGDTNQIQSFRKFLMEKGFKAIILEATHAFHSRHMDPMLEAYRKIAQSIKYKPGNGSVQYLSGMEGRIICDAAEMGADYWIRHTREKVSFVDACTALRETGCQDFVEVGPQPVLSSFVMMNNEDMQLNCFPSLRRGTDDWQTVLTTLGKLYLLGHQVNWKGFEEPYNRKKVSLPFHPFNRKSFWIECTGSTAPMIHPLLGCPMNNASSINIFQNDLSLKALPYVKDHCIGSRIVFPGAGYAEMCLTAAYYVANGLTDNLEPPRRPMALKNVRIDAPLELSEDKSCRLQVIVDLPDLASPSQQQQDSGFRVKVFHQNTSHQESGKWVLHASSTFIPVASTTDKMKMWNPERISEIQSKGEKNNSDSFYKRIDEVGLKYGPAFRMIKNYWRLKQENTKENMDDVVAELELPPDHTKYILHPLILDAVMQSGVLTRLPYEDAKLKVPVRVEQLTFFTGIPPNENSGAKESSPRSLYIHSWIENRKIYIFLFTHNKIPIALIEDVELLDTNVRTIESVLEQQSSSVPDAWEEVWKVIPSPFASRIDFTDPISVLDDSNSRVVCEKLRDTSPEDKDLWMKTNTLVYLCIVNALMELGWQPSVGDVFDVDSFCAHLDILSEFKQLVRFYFMVMWDEARILSRDPQSDCWTVQALPPTHHKIKTEMHDLCKYLKTTKINTVTGIYENIAENLANVLQGEESALALLFPVEEDKQQFSADSYYQNHPGRSDLKHVMTTLSHNLLEKQQIFNRNAGGKIMRVLEVGSGTGSMSAHFISLLQENWGDNFEFYFTDISQSFFVKAEKRLEEVKRNVKYAVFNIEQSPLSQGIPTNYFDVVIATDVLHATRYLKESLVHLRQTLRPGGYLYFTETIIPARDTTFVFGLLSGYWRYEDFDYRPHHTCVSEHVWTRLLLETGFNMVRAFKVYNDEFGCILANAADDDKIACLDVNVETPEPKMEWVIFSDSSHVELSSNLANMLDASGFQVIIVHKLGRTGQNEAEKALLKPTVQTLVIPADSQNIADLESVFWKGKSGDSRVQGVIYAWGLDGNESGQETVSLPFLHIAKILMTLKKLPQLFILSESMYLLNDDSFSNNPTPATLFGMAKSLKNESGSIFIRCVDLERGVSPSTMTDQVLYEMAMHKGFKEQNRFQVVYRDGIRYEPRITKIALDALKSELKLPPCTDRYQLILPKTRIIQDLEFDSLHVAPVRINEIEVKVKAYALNFRDIFAILKPSAEFEKINSVGLDFSGVVTKAGPESGIQVGEHVFGADFNETQLPSHLVVEADTVLRIPNNMTFWEAVTYPAVVSTAYHCLITVARIKKQDTILIHTGSGGVGLAAIQVAQHVGATIITTAGNPRKREYLRSLGIEHVFHSRNTSYEKNIMEVTKGRGVDIVLNSITGPGFKEATLASCARNARFIEMSKLSVWTPQQVKEMRADVAYSIVDLTGLGREEWVKLLANVRKYIEGGRLKPIPYVKFDALNIRQALHYFQKAKHIGKVICAMPEVTTEDGQFQVKVALFNGDSTYLITGGLGGIGFEVCKWMLGLGATDIVLTGRNPPKSDIAVQIEQLNKQGFNVMVKLGDVGNYEQCKRIIDKIQGEEKPLRGLMHCAGVLRDNLFANQTWQHFQATFKPKVDGTWNLHHLTKALPMEHFIMFSSVTALIGTPGQPNHSAANCFEDSFINYRHSIGLPGMTINWGQWSQVGCAKEIFLPGLFPVSVTRMLNGLEMAIRAQKRQICFNEFDSFQNLSILAPLLKTILDERLWLASINTGHINKAFKSEEFWKELDEAETKKEKVQVLSAYLKDILRSALRLDAQETMSDDANLQDLGVDSLMLIELKNSIQTLLGNRVVVTASLIKNCPTIRHIANAVINKMLEDEGEEEVCLEPLPKEELIQLLAKDCVLDESIFAQSPACSFSECKTILITGSTGQLAPYIISQLCSSYKSVDKIVCLVRGADDATTATEKLTAVFRSMDLMSTVDISRVECVTGDVTSDKLGMTSEMYHQLCNSVDVVIHCAAKSNQSEPYRVYDNDKHVDLRSVNVGGTVNVLKFAATSKTKHIFYPSTFICGLVGISDESTLPDHWPEKRVIEYVNETNLPGLQTTKLIAEILLKQANDAGIPCKVFRFPWIAGESSSGRISYLNNLYILRFLGFLKLGAMSSLVFPANFLPVDVCAEVSLNLFFRDETSQELFNVGHPQPQVEQEFIQIANQVLGKDMKILEWREFMGLLKERSETESDLIKTLYKNQETMSAYLAEVFILVKGYVLSPHTFFTNNKLHKYLPEYGTQIPSSMEILERDLQFVKSTGFFDQFGI